MNSTALNRGKTAWNRSLTGYLPASHWWQAGVLSVRIADGEAPVSLSTSSLVPSEHENGWLGGELGLLLGCVILGSLITALIGAGICYLCCACSGGVAGGRSNAGRV
ncbi:protein of unknown function (plasmid) [Pararobbsia alpina]